MAFLLVFVLVIAPVAQAKWLTILSDKVRIPVPDDYDVTPDDELDDSTAEGITPILLATSPDDAVILLAYYYRNVDLQSSGLGDTLEDFKASMPAEFPSFKWVSSNIRTIDRTRAIYLEFNHKNGDLEMVTIQLIFPHDGKMGIVQVMCETSDYDKSKATVQRILNNIKFSS